MTYPANWHTLYGNQTGESARRILPPLLRQFAVSSTVEVGCGNAHWTQAAVDSGVAAWLVVDGPWNKRDELLVDSERFLEFDLSHPLILDRRYDLAICLEVAEHVSADAAKALVESLVNAADVILFGAAIPFQGGFGHINEQWPSWWRGLFAAHGYQPYDLVRPVHWEDTAIHYWYRQNAFVYVRQSNSAASAIAQAAAPGPIVMFDAVHPEKYALMASYEAIAFKRLARRLPGWLINRIKSRLRGD